MAAKSKLDFIFNGVDNTKKAFNSIGRGLGKTTKLAKTTSKAIFGITATATAAAGTLAYFAKRNIDTLDTLGKTASKLGINVEFLQKMRFAAEQTGIETRTLDMGLQRFIRRVAEAAQGTGEAKDALAQLGINFTDAEGRARPIQDILFDVADGMAATASEGERVRLAFKFFDSEGVALVNTLKNGSAALKEYFDEAENLGILISEDTTKKAEAFKDSLNIVNNQFTALAQNITAGFLPALTVISKDMSKFLRDTKDEVGGFDTLGQAVAIGVMNSVKGFITSLAGFMDSVDNFFRATAGGITLVRYGIAELALHTLQVRQSLFGLFKDLGPEIIDAKIKVMQLGGELAALNGEPTDEFTKAAKTTTDYIDKLVASIKEGGPAISDLLDSMGGGQAADSMTKFINGIGAAKDNLDQITVGSMKKLEDSMIESLKAGKLSFKDFSDYVVEQLLRIAIQELVIKKITGFASSFFGDFGNLFRASGGPVSANKPYIVGERGPEVFIPSGAGNIAPNSSMQPAASGGAVVNFNISTVDASGFDELLASRKGMITAMINNAMNARGKMGVV